jgi:hypothetical protein
MEKGKKSDKVNLKPASGIQLNTQNSKLKTQNQG